jgi:MFS transporter, YNFM family, putative membrane transport protein
MASGRSSSTWPVRPSTAPAETSVSPAGGAAGPLPYFGLGLGAFLALYLPQPLLPELDRDLRTSPAVTGLVMTAALLGFAGAGLLREGEPARTLRRAVWLTVAGSVGAALSPSIWVLLPARAAQGVGIGLLVAGGLADVPRRMPRAVAGRFTGALISGTALGGLGGRAIGYTGNFLTWRGAFLVGGAGVLLVVLLSLRSLPLEAGHARPSEEGRGASVPFSLVLAGGFILFVSVGMFDLLPYRLSAPPFHLPALLADLVYLAFVPATVVGVLAGRAIDRFGRRAVVLATAAAAVGLMLLGLLPYLPAVAAAATAAICATVSLHVAHSGAAAAYGRRAVGRYLAAYYVGGGAAAPLLAMSYVRWDWPGVILPLCAAALVVALLSLAREEAHRPEGQQLDPGIPPAGGGC